VIETRAGNVKGANLLPSAFTRVTVACSIEPILAHRPPPIAPAERTEKPPKAAMERAKTTRPIRIDIFRIYAADRALRHSARARSGFI
jgi:hypothetical protein